MAFQDSIFSSTFPPLLCLGAMVFAAACASNGRVGDEAGSGSSLTEKASRYGLGPVREAVPGAKIDLRYRFGSNVTGKPMYPGSMPCLANRSTATKLARVQQSLEKEGYGLLIWDAWRPPEAQMALWNAVKDPRYVVPPSDGLSMHCYGIAVDVSMVDSFGRPVKMPSRFDEFTSAARSNYTGSDPEIRENLERLKRAMKSEGFRAIPNEWWHFDDLNAKSVRRVTAKDLGLRLPL